MLNLDKSKKYLLACSYGPDSMALFSMLKNEGYNFSVAHVNYGVRKEAEEETINLNSYCAANDIEIEIKYVKIPAKSSNFEAKARDFRYLFFKEIMENKDYEAVLVAHNQDDFLETYYLQKQRKSLVEFYGIKKETFLHGIRVIRPLLKYKKDDLQKYCDNNKVPYAIDSSNLSDDFQRNVIRHKIVSIMNDRERKILLNDISKLNNNLEKEISYLKDNDLTSVDFLSSLKDSQLQRALVMEYRKINIEGSLSSSFVNEFKKVLQSIKPNVILKLDKDVILVKEYSKVYFKKVSDDNLFSYTLDKPDELKTKYFYLNFIKGSNNRNVYEDSYPITIRSPKKDDEMIINGYKVSLRRLFIDWKMPLLLRKKWPVIVNKDNRIIYVPRYREDFIPKDDDNFIVYIK